jgi:hypothetical protein
MSARERVLAILLGCFIIFGGSGFGIWKIYLPMLRARDAELAELEQRSGAREKQLAEMEAKKKQYEAWRKMSLPAGDELTRTWAAYEGFLNDLIKDSGHAPDALTIASQRPQEAPKAVRGKKPAYIQLTYQVQGKTTLDLLVQFLEEFYKTPLLHHIKSMTIRRVEPLRVTQQTGADGADAQPGFGGGPGGGRGFGRGGPGGGFGGGPGGRGPRGGPGGRGRGGSSATDNEVDVTLVIEALVLDSVKTRDTLIPKDVSTPERLASGRNYKDIARKNIFLGPSADSKADPIEITRYVRLTSITEDLDAQKTEAFFRDLASPLGETRMRATTPFDQFKIKDPQGEDVIKGKVVRITDRDVIFQIDDKFYRLHVGESFEQAMKQAIPESEAKELGLAAAGME